MEEADLQPAPAPAFCNSSYFCTRRTRMKRAALLLFLAGWLVPLASAQDHFQVGAYGDYFRLSQTDTNMAGNRARVCFQHLSLLICLRGVRINFFLKFSYPFPASR